MNNNTSPLVFAHIGDLHITNSKERNYLDFLSILVQIEIECSRNLDFVYLPGDIADHGQAAQYKLVATPLNMLSVPVYAIAGDHDMEQGSLSDFYTYLRAAQMPYSITVKGVVCVFLDVNGSGKGGPDFRLGNGQLEWLKKALAEVKEGDPVIIFMHTYPDDLAESREKDQLVQLIAQYKVALVEMGHTHYNELANDGTAIYAATRSTGQIEEGPVGYSLVSVDDGIVSWRFKALDDGFPFVLITAPCDRRLQPDGHAYANEDIIIRAVVFGDKPVQEVTCWINNQDPFTMNKDVAGYWTATIPALCQDASITVQAVDSTGRPGRHTIQLQLASPSTIRKIKTGSDTASIGGWIDNGILGTQLGPNRNAKPQK